jgi:hypothetical protein
MTTLNCYALFSLCLIPALGGLHAQTVNDPYYVTGANAIDPVGRMEVSIVAPGATSAGTLTALGGFGAVQDFGGFTGNASLGSSRIFTFSNAALPAIQFTFGGSVRTDSTVTLNNASYATSRDAFSSALRLQPWGGVGNIITLQIRFGGYEGGAFQSAGSGSGVAAVGFTLSGQYNMLTDSGIVITYLDAIGGVLSTQTLKDADATTTVAGYTGYKIGAGESPIASVLITYESASGGPTFGLDDLGFTAYQAIPEPSAVSLISGGVALAMFGLSRRRGGHQSR